MPSIPSFPDFFKALWGYDPFPWQSMLAERIAVESWPRALDLPTAAGKTACIDAAVYALAFQASKPVTERTAPRRIWFVVDRRIVVDEAFERASLIAEKLAMATAGPLKAVADRLLGLGGTTRPLAVARLRGGILRDDNWGRLPSQPAVITSTIDQLGSRLLFRGYGRGNLTASIYAGLAAHDSLILLDEAHLSMPFLETLSAIERFRGATWAKTPIATPFAFAFLSATLPEMPQDEVFPRQDERERALDHPLLRERMSASKPATIVMVKSCKSKGDLKAEDVLVLEAAVRANSYIESHGKRRVAVIVNRVKTARDIYVRLQKRVSDKADIVLLTGRIRPYERDRLIEKWKPFLRAVSPEQPERPIILVSTQCLEVGADFSFDALVTEAASLDALRQRFGRLNRLGAPGAAPATILLREKDTKKSTPPDPVYGTAMFECWKLLNDKATETSKGKKKERIIDFGIDAFECIQNEIDPEELRQCLAPHDEAPVLLPAHLDLLCQTAPAPAVEPDISLFLHGKERGVPEVRIVWRADLPADKQSEWGEIIALCPPVSGEMLSVPIYRLRAWLAEETSEDDETSDVEGAVMASDGADDAQGVNNRNKTIRPALVWRGRDNSRVADRASAIKPNDVIIVPAAYGMPEAGQAAPTETLGKDGLDVYEPAQGTSGRPPTMRLNRAVLAPWLGCESVEELVSVAEDPAKEREAIQSAINALVADHTVTLPQWLRDLIGKVRNGRIENHPGGGCVLFAKKDSMLGAAEPDLFADDDDLLSAIGGEVTLERHSVSVERTVEKIAGRCLPGEFLDPLRHAAYWHDVGKLDDRFQLVLRQGDEIASGLGEPLAKSAFVPTSPARWKAICTAAGLPKGFRHEMLSLQLAERHATAPIPEQDTDLFLHLVASHHGHARPFAPVVPDPEPPAISGRHDDVGITMSAAERAESVAPHRLGSGVTDRFWRLTRQYGWWGLAYLEAILRLADWYGSEHVMNEDVSRESHRSSSQAHRTGTSSTVPCNEPLVLTGIDGANPLGFLAALGTLLLLRQGAFPEARLAWKRTATWQPFLTGILPADQNALCNALEAALRGRSVPNDAEATRQEAQKAFDKAKTALKKKKEEITKRKLRGKEREAAMEKEVQPLKQELNQKRDVWLEALKQAVPSPELALGKHIDCTSDEYRQCMEDMLKDSDFVKRAPLDLLAAFASDGCVESSGRVSATPFCFVTGSGSQYFLDTVRKLMEQVTVERIRSVLFEPWTYTDKKLSLRWDPKEAARYALMDVNPSDLGAYTVWMANLLAYQALMLLPSAPGKRGLETTGWRDTEFSWPIWQYPADPDTIRSCILLSDLGANSPDRSVLRDRGIAAIFRAKRVKVGSERNFKINFEPARGI